MPAEGMTGVPSGRVQKEGDSPITVLLCEDSLGFRMLATAWLEDADDMELVGIAETGAEAVDMATSCAPGRAARPPAARR